jgi:hypothetical protein
MPLDADLSKRSASWRAAALFQRAEVGLDLDCNFAGDLHISEPS